MEKGESPYIFEEAITKMRDAADFLLDPDLDGDLRQFEIAHARLA